MFRRDDCVVDNMLSGLRATIGQGFLHGRLQSLAMGSEGRSGSHAAASATSFILLVAASLLAIAIFVLDTATPLGMAIAVLYVVVLMIAGNVFRRRGILLTAAACAALTVLSYTLQHGDVNPVDSLGRCLMSLSAIGITTFLVMQNHSTRLTLSERASLLDLTHDTVFVRDMRDVITYWNRAAEEMYGWTTEEAVGKATHALMQTVFPAPLDEITDELIRTGRWEGELVHTSRDGRQIIVASRWSLQRDKHENAVAILETNTDITERKRAEAKIRQQEEDLRLALDTIPTLASWGRQDGYIEYVNRRWLEYTGLRLTQASHWDWQSVVHPDDLPGLIERRRLMVAAGKPGEMEIRLRHADGEYRWFLARTEPLRDQHGNITKWYTVHIDIQDRKSAEDALRRSEAYLAEAQQLSLTGSFGWRTDHRELVWSEQTYRIFDYDPALKPTIDMVLQRVHPEDVETVRRAIGEGSRKGAPLDLAHRLSMPDGSVKYVRVLAHPTTDRSYGWDYVGAITDVTAATEAEQALQRAQAELAHAARVAMLGELAASIVHEVNQPLTGIVMRAGASLHYVGRDPPDLDQARQAMESVVRDGRRAGEVVNRLRALAQKKAPHKAAVEINDVINEVLLMLGRELLTHRVTARIALASGLAPVLGDRIQLQQVVLNLIMNAIDAMSSVGERPRELVIRSQQHAPDELVVAVQDSGVGFDPADADRLFQTFFTTKSNGMGMGLAICRSVIEAHGGRLWASPNAEAGATFQFVLPFNRQDQTLSV
jgi:PAS domain S-box-containing protein